MFKDFVSFLKEFNIVSLAVGFVMGSASTALVHSLVQDIVMPILAPLLSGGAWKEAALDIGAVHIAYGVFLGELINFLILALIIFIVVKKLFKAESRPKQ